MRSREDVLRLAYAAFNARDIDAALELMHPDVDWPNACGAGSDELISESDVLHRFHFEDGLIVRMDVVEPPAGDSRQPP